jgi:HD-GYP domain-containing protein (c-di-GMP phosphodiesterase class II)
MFEHKDLLADLNAKLPLDWKIACVHRAVRARFPFVERVAVAAYDPATHVVKTFLASDAENQNPLSHYEAKLEDAPSLAETVRLGRPRVVNDLSVFKKGEHEHTKRIGAEGYGASYTLPVFHQGLLWGFVFFDSRKKAVFTEAVLAELDVYGHLVASLSLAEHVSIRLMEAAIKTAREMVHERDPETGEHLERMSRFSRLIAQEMARSGEEWLDDEKIEKIFLYAPLHDLGKLGIPDRVLLKPGGLTPSERELMETHPSRGVRMVDTLLRNFGLDTFPGTDVLRNIAELHHESVDGMGYPKGLLGKEIPIEARIVAVADVFDALTSKRPYKPAWTNDDAFAFLERLAGTHFDPDCVRALVASREKVEEIQARFVPSGT